MVVEKHEHTSGGTTKVTRQDTLEVINKVSRDKDRGDITREY